MDCNYTSHSDTLPSFELGAIYDINGYNYTTFGIITYRTTAYLVEMIFPLYTVTLRYIVSTTGICTGILDQVPVRAYVRDHPMTVCYAQYLYRLLFVC